MIGIIDYGSGNLRSVYNAFRYLGADVKVCETPEDMKGAERIVFPGVGSSRDAMNGLSERGLIGPLLDNITRGVPFLGICLGLQLLFDTSDESGGTDCLGLIRGKVKLFPGGEDMKVPQIGWNTVNIMNYDCPIFKGIEDKTYFYFVHSYYCESAEEEYTAGITEYSASYTSALWKDNIFAVQFHPERSQAMGLKILENFIKT
ncbi:MAG: imidazole glycerol phosphate synthase subunit HisH [Candidatus Omnitrophica bacterium]|nr:imidazole glycerol phosphate synthase subunit HisH [Candidatus Omnitrophota bacterium]